MPYTQLFFIEGKLLGTAPRGLTRVHETYQLPLSALYFCQHCGEVFARCPVQSEEGIVRPWQSYRTTCRKCLPSAEYLSEYPGCLWRTYDTDFNAALPEAVLRYELLCLLDAFERFQK